jgi:hypothetical protein
MYYFDEIFGSYTTNVVSLHHNQKTKIMKTITKNIKFNGKIYNGFVFINDEKIAIENVDYSVLIERIINQAETDIIGLGGVLTQEQYNRIIIIAEGYKKMSREQLINNYLEYAASIRNWLKNNK